MKTCRQCTVSRYAPNSIGKSINHRLSHNGIFQLFFHVYIGGSGSAGYYKIRIACPKQLFIRRFCVSEIYRINVESEIIPCVISSCNYASACKTPYIRKASEQCRHPFRTVNSYTSSEVIGKSISVAVIARCIFTAGKKRCPLHFSQVRLFCQSRLKEACFQHNQSPACLLYRQNVLR